MVEQDIAPCATLSGMPTPPSTADRLAEDRRQHLDFIQTVVGRMFSASSLAKGWCLTVATVATAALGFALTEDSRPVGLLGALAVLLFGFLDGRYLREERKFRALYKDARLGHIDVYDMCTDRYVQRGNESFDPHCQWRSVLRSWSLWTFYAPLIVVAVAVVVRTWLRQ